MCESSFGAYVCHRRPALLHRNWRLLFVLKRSAFILTESLKSVAQGIFEIFEEVCLGMGGGGGGGMGLSFSVRKNCWSWVLENDEYGGSFTLLRIIHDLPQDLSFVRDFKDRYHRKIAVLCGPQESATLCLPLIVQVWLN